ncbi:MAG: hypothetical protein K6C11_02605, partial [Bacilli bacterium]|nr:hypothetical protein [Bacilli bacterium]
GKFTMSSYGMWDVYIQPSYHSTDLEPIIGQPLSIRSDEWLTTIPEILSQQYNNYGYYSDIIRGSKTDMFAASSIPIKNFLIISRPFMLGYVLFGIDYGSSIFWFGRLILLFMITFEFLMLLTKGNKKISLLISSMITFSAPVAWWGFMDLIIAGEGAIWTFNKMLYSKKNLIALLWSLLLTFFILEYGFALYPAWMVPMAYIFGGLALYYLIDYIKNKGKILRLLYLIIPLIASILFVAYFYLNSKGAIETTMNTVYPGARFETGGAYYGVNYNYIFNMFMKFTALPNPSEASMFYSFFPFTYVLAAVSLLLNKKKNPKLLLLLAISVFMFVFMFFGLPSWLAKITLIFVSPVQRMAVVYSYLLLLITALSINDIEYNDRKIKILVNILAVICALFSVYMSYVNNMDYVVSKVLILSLFIGILMNLLIANYNEKNRMFINLIVIVFFFGTFIVVNPISIKLSAIYDKPLAKELSKYRQSNSRLLWASMDDIATGDYLLANGIRSVNSVNPYPDLDRWYIIDPDHGYENVYNRYAHIMMVPDKKKTTFELVQSDLFIVHILPSDLCKIDVDYITSRQDMSVYNNKKVNFENEYFDDGIYIYKVNCR